MSARYAVGGLVRTKVMNHPGHCRLPRYVQARYGTVEHVHGQFALADESARGLPDPPREHVYTVRFSSAELWGDDAAQDLTVCIDLWESYLLPTDGREPVPDREERAAS